VIVFVSTGGIFETFSWVVSVLNDVLTCSWGLRGVNVKLEDSMMNELATLTEFIKQRAVIDHSMIDKVSVRDNLGIRNW